MASNFFLRNILVESRPDRTDVSVLLHLCSGGHDFHVNFQICFFLTSLNLADPAHVVRCLMDTHYVCDDFHFLLAIL